MGRWAVKACGEQASMEPPIARGHARETAPSWPVSFHVHKAVISAIPMAYDAGRELSEPRSGLIWRALCSGWLSWLTNLDTIWLRSRVNGVRVRRLGRWRVDTRI
jgi:hypothetical protein